MFSQAIKYCIHACYYGVLWDLKTIEDRLEAGSPVDAELASLKQRQNQFMELMKQLLPLSDVQMYRDEVSVLYYLTTPNVSPLTMMFFKNILSVLV